MEAQSMSNIKFPTRFEYLGRFNQTSKPFNNYIKFPILTSIKCVKYGIKSKEPPESEPKPESKKMLVLGMGYVAQYFAHQLINDGWEISGTCTSSTKKKELEQKGFNAHVFNACQPEYVSAHASDRSFTLLIFIKLSSMDDGWKILETLSSYTHLLVSVPPIENVGDPVLQHGDQLRSRLLRGNLQWLCYLSSTSVYGDSEGAWVDEDYSPKPSSNLSKMRLSAEEGWLKLGEDLGLSTHIFRLGGIYGPGRSAVDTILKKEQLSDRQKRRTSRNFTSRVHVADICQALGASISTEFQSKIYNIVDDDPASRAEVFEYAQQLINTRWPGLVTTNDISVQRTPSTGGEKRVLNARMKNELGVRLLHPSYRSGLQSIIDRMAD